MPFGPQPLGFVYFAGVKLVGYTAFCKWAIEPRVRHAWSGSGSINEHSQSPQFQTLHLEQGANGYNPAARTLPSPWKAGAIRTALGVAIGTVVGIGFWKIPALSTSNFPSSVLFFLLLIPVRVLEWWLLLRWCYWPAGLSRKALIWLMVFGILASFIIDVVGIFSALILPGGAWIC